MTSIIKRQLNTSLVYNSNNYIENTNFTWTFIGTGNQASWNYAGGPTLKHLRETSYLKVLEHLHSSEHIPRQRGRKNKATTTKTKIKKQVKRRLASQA